MTASSSASVGGCGDEEDIIRYLLRCAIRCRRNLCLVSRAIQMNAIKKAIIALVLFTTSLFAAAPQFFSSGGTSIERNRLIHIEQSLNFTQEPMTSQWNVIIDPPDVFRKNVEDMMKSHSIDYYTDTAYTALPLMQTHINEEHIFDDGIIRHTMAHEAGHLICECHSEDKANEIAYQLETR